ncbi:MAG: hypothetical protein HYZ34_08865 [Ignavibacteriae bacterium]|nr:hypothetical protein [Ignavibacteriota bacterium]
MNCQLSIVNGHLSIVIGHLSLIGWLVVDEKIAGMCHALVGSDGVMEWWSF